MKTRNALFGLGVATTLAAGTYSLTASAHDAGHGDWGMMGGYGPGYSQGCGPGYGPMQGYGPGYGHMYGYGPGSGQARSYGPGMMGGYAYGHGMMGW